MNLNSLRHRAASTVRQDAFVGTWRVLQWQPDLFGQQRFVVGSLVESSSGERAFQLMEKPERIECFFRPKPIRREFAALMALLRSSLAAIDNGWVSPSPNFSMSEPCFVRGESAKSVAERIFAEMVVAAKPLPDGEPDREIGPNTEETRREVSVFLKQMADLAFERIVREQGQTLSEHFFDVTLAPDHGAGSIVSACYKSLQSIELKLLRAAQDINAYATSQKRHAKAIFLLDPADDAPIPPKERKAMDLLIGNECWKLEQSGFDTPRNTEFRGMASDIHDWAIPLIQR